MRDGRAADRARGALRRAVARVATVALAGAMVGATAAAPAQAVIETIDPFAVNQGFSYVATGNMSLGNSEMEGSAAAFGTLASTGDYGVIHNSDGMADYTVPTIDGDPVRLLGGEYVGSGAFDLTNRDDSGTIDPDSPEATAIAKFAETSGLSGAVRGSDWTRVTNDEGGILDLEALPWDASTWQASVTTDQPAVEDYFGDVDGQVEQTNTCLAAMYGDDDLAHEVTVEGDGSLVFLSDFSTTEPNYVDYEDVAGTTIKTDRAGGYVPTAQAPLVVRVNDPTTVIGPLNVEGWSPQAGQQQSYARYMLFDLSQVSAPVTIDGLEMGAIWAPGVDLTFTGNRTTNGQWFADDITTTSTGGGGELHHHAFLGQLRCETEVPAPQIATSVAVVGSDDGTLPAEGGTVVDTVSYTGLTPGVEYTLAGAVMTADGDATAIAGTTTFTPDAADGTVGVTFTVTAAQAADYAGQDLVVFESLTAGGEEVAAHEDLADGDQTFGVAPGPAPATFSVVKEVEGSGADLVPAGTVFTVGFEVTAGPDTGETGQVEVPADGTPVVYPGDLTDGDVLTFSEPELPDVDGVEWGTPVIAPNPVVLDAGLDVPVQVTVTNTATAQPVPATFSVVKEVEGSGADLVPAGTVFTVGFEVTAGPDTGETGQVEVPADGTPVVYPGDLTDGDVLTFSEPELPDVDGVEWGTPVIAPNPVALDAGLDAPVQVTVTNTATAEATASGFSVAKTIAGSGADLVEPDTVFVIGWEVVEGPDTGESGTLEVPADGTPVDGPQDLAAGDVVELTEAEVPVDGAVFAGATFDPSTIVIDPEAGDVTVAATNVYDVAPGTFELRKEITGSAADQVPDGTEFSVAWTVTDGPSDGASGTMTVPADGSTVAGPTLAHGDTVVLSELAPPAVDGVVWGDATIDPATLTIDATADPVLVTVTNMADAAVVAPSIVTSVAVPGSPGGVLPVGGGTVVDTVTFTGLTLGQEYVLDGELHRAVGGDPTGITGSTTFTPGAPDGSVDVTFQVSAAQAAALAGQDLVVFQSLSAGGSEVAVHEDLMDGAQTFTVADAEAAISSEVVVRGSDDGELPRTGGTVVDTVAYEGLVPGLEYELSGELRVAPSGAETWLAASTTFTPDAPVGTVDVEFALTATDAAQLAGRDLVAFQTVTLDGATVASERDLRAESQTFAVAEQDSRIDTSVLVKGNDARVVPASGGTVVDTITYTDLTPGVEYVISGSLIRAQNQASTGIAGSIEFTPTEAQGQLVVSFVVSPEEARRHPGTFVVFETLWVNGTMIAGHQDIDDEAQTFTIAGDVPGGGSLPRTGADGVGWALGASGASVLAGLGLLWLRRRGLAD